VRWALAALWASFVFATSCTAVSRPAFVRMVAAVLPDGALRGAWVRFWYGCDLLVVKGYHAAEFALLFLLPSAATRPTGPGRSPLS
jgi:hypothetical protein